MTTASVQHLISPASLPVNAPGEEGLSVLSYNVLLPNSQADGWWNYKMYHPAPLHDHTIASWDYRRELLQQRIATINADVVCIQEASPDTFDDDFAFMKQQLGYDGVAVSNKKGRFLPATFWKTSKCQLASPVVHKDRSLITAFTIVNEAPSAATDDQEKHAIATTNPCWYVVNVHLQAGKQGPRRLRQIHEAIKGVVTLSRKLNSQHQPKTSTSTPLRLIVCGDMNGGAECGALRFLEDGYVDETFLEDNEPVTSSRKELPLSEPLRDVMTTSRTDPPPPTLVVAELMTSLMEEASYDSPVLSSAMLERLSRIYHQRLASDHVIMTRQDVERWLIQINGKLGRGDEFRNAAIQMGWIDPIDPEAPWEERKPRVQLPANGVLTLEGFYNVYRHELDRGKFWGIAHDMAVLGDPLPDQGLFRARYDRIYHSAAIEPTAILDTLADQPCPNEQEPSDHLPVAATFRAVAS